MEKEKLVEIVNLETGLNWPYWRGKKALSPSSITRALRNIEYKNIPEFILLKAAKRGKKFHNVIQNFIKNGCVKSDEIYKEVIVKEKIDKQIEETLRFIEKEKIASGEKFVGSETLRYNFHENELLASYIDLEFDSFIIELKTNNKSAAKSSVSLMALEIQMIVQKICTGKDVYLLWSTGEGVIFEKLKTSDLSLKSLSSLVEFKLNEEKLSEEEKKNRMKEIIGLFKSSLELKIKKID